MSNNGLGVAGLLIYLLPMAVVLLVYLRRHRERTQLDSVALKESVAAGMTEPASLHPEIDPDICIGCAACTTVCPEMPEHRVLGIVDGKAALVSPTDCIGHGACQAACPVGAISLVFGTEKRGIDIPHVKPDFESNVPGIYIAGELGGMGLIRNAIEQGRQAMQSVGKAIRHSSGLDVLIVGAGPAGISASLAAKELGLSYVTVEQDSLGGTVAHFPRGKLVMTAPAFLPIVGKVRFKEVSKESLLAFWEGVQADTNLDIHFQERVEAIKSRSGGFDVQTSSATYRPRKILLAMGRRGTPRKLDVPGEELNKVTYRLIDPEQYADQAVLVVGGGDSALEAACALVATCRSVTLAYRSAAFSRAKQKNRDAVAALEQSGGLTVHLSSDIVRIEPDKVILRTSEADISVANDVVIVCVGGILPSAFLRSAGIEVETRHGSR